MKNLSQIRKCFAVWAVMLTPLIPAQSFAGNETGNGGDIVSSYLEASRYALVNTLQILKLNTVEQGRVCGNIKHLSTTQVQECQKFLTQATDQILRLNSFLPVTPFLVRPQPLEVLGPDGQLRPVDARTVLGPKGPIEFNFFNIRYYTPEQLLQLVTHEFGHKVLFQGSYVEDNSPTEAFPTGRDLLDGFAEAIVLAAKKHGYIKDGYILTDYFICSIHVGPPSYILIPTEAAAVRTFSDPKNLDAYDITIGSQEVGSEVCIEDRNQKSKISLRIEIHEEKGCQAVQSPSHRWTRIQLVRFQKNNSFEVSSPEILVSQEISNFNPVCQRAERREPFGLNYGEIRFECQYSGSGVVSLNTQPTH